MRPAKPGNIRDMRWYPLHCLLKNFLNWMYEIKISTTFVAQFTNEILKTRKRTQRVLVNKLSINHSSLIIGDNNG
jgi:hypothetical protein